MKISTGEYIVFIDSDDWIELSMIDFLYNLLIENNCEVASCGVKMVWEDDRPIKFLLPFDGCYVLEGAEYALDCLITNKYLIQTVWNKIYKADLIKNIEFPKGKINEDEYWSWRVIADTSRVVCDGTPLYNYVQRSGSIMRNASFNPMFALEANCLRYDYIVENFPMLQDKCCIYLLYSCLYQAQRSKLLLSHKQYNDYYKQIKIIVKSHKPRKEAFENLSFKKKLRIKSIYYTFGFVCTVQNLLGIGNETNIA
jgi:glycosyltransferase involved in cell wall biosynthesis